MRKIVIGIAVSAGLLLSGGALAEEKKAEAPKMEMPKPTAEHKKLGYFTGHWKIDGEMKPGVMGPGGKMTGTADCKWFSGGFSVVCNESGKSPMGAFKSMGVMSYSAEEKAYSWMGIDSMGMSETAKGKVENDVWTYTNESKMNGKTYKGRYTIKDTKPDSYAFVFEMSEDGTNWMTAGEGKYTREKAAAK